MVVLSIVVAGGTSGCSARKVNSFDIQATSGWFYTSIGVTNTSSEPLEQVSLEVTAFYERGEPKTCEAFFERWSTKEAKTVSVATGDGSIVRIRLKGKGKSYTKYDDIRIDYETPLVPRRS